MQDGTSFSGKKLKKKEVDLGSLREALQETIGEQALPVAPLPDADGIEDAADIIAMGGDDRQKTQSKGGILSPGQKITF